MAAAAVVEPKVRRLATEQAKAQPEVPDARTWSPLAYTSRGPVSILTTIHPDVAYKMLECNTHNRTVSDNHVKRLAADMAAGKWIITHQGIAYSAEGVLLDGQHRLFAITQADVPITMMVSYNVSEASLGVIDIGKARTVGQTWDLLQGEVKNGRVLVSRASVIQRLAARSANKAKFLYADAQSAFNAYKDGLLWSLKAMPGAKGGDTAAVSGALAFAYPVDPDKVNTFAIQVRTGEMLTKNDPAYALRRLLSEHPSSGNKAQQLVSYATVRSVYAYIRGESLQVLKPNMLLGQGEGMATVVEEAIRFFEKANKRAQKK